MARRSSTASRHEFPWQQGRACHEDRAMGFELELIELVRRREAAAAHDEPLEALDREIDEVMASLVADAAVVAA